MKTTNMIVQFNCTKCREFNSHAVAIVSGKIGSMICSFCGHAVTEKHFITQKRTMSKEQQTQAEIKEGLQRRILDLQNEVVALRQEISEQPRVDELHRKNFTMLLGKPEDKILSWAEVYFELGVLTVQAERYEGDELTMCEKEKCNCDRVHF